MTWGLLTFLVYAAVMSGHPEFMGYEISYITFDKLREHVQKWPDNE